MRRRAAGRCSIAQSTAARRRDALAAVTRLPRRTTTQELEGCAGRRHVSTDTTALLPDRWRQETSNQFGQFLLVVTPDAAFRARRGRRRVRCPTRSARGTAHVERASAGAAARHRAAPLRAGALAPVEENGAEPDRVAVEHEGDDGRSLTLDRRRPDASRSRRAPIPTGRCHRDHRPHALRLSRRRRADAALPGRHDVSTASPAPSCPIPSTSLESNPDVDAAGTGPASGGQAVKGAATRARGPPRRRPGRRSPASPRRHGRRRGIDRAPRGLAAVGRAAPRLLARRPALPSAWPEGGPRRRWERPLGDGYLGDCRGRRRALHDDAARRARGRRQPARRYRGHALGDRYDGAVLERRTRWSMARGHTRRRSSSSGRVFAVGSTGLLHALDASSGKVMWTHDLVGELEGFIRVNGYACSPLAWRETGHRHGRGRDRRRRRLRSGERASWCGRASGIASRPRRLC